MVVSPQHFTDITNGYEKTTSGLWTHKGKLDAASLRATQNVWPNAGAGVETLYDRPSGTGWIQSYDRDASQYRDLRIDAHNITLVPQSGGTLEVPDGSIKTADLANNAANGPLTYYTAVPTWSTPGPGWVQTPITVSFQTTGGQLRIEYSLTAMHTVANAQWQVAIGWDGTMQMGVQYVPGTPLANVPMTVNGSYYVVLSAGGHSVQLFVYLVNAGTLSLYAGTYQLLYVTEQKR